MRHQTPEKHICGYVIHRIIFRFHSSSGHHVHVHPKRQSPCQTCTQEMRLARAHVCTSIRVCLLVSTYTRVGKATFDSLHVHKKVSSVQYSIMTVCCTACMGACVQPCRLQHPGDMGAELGGWLPPMWMIWCCWLQAQSAPPVNQRFQTIKSMPLLLSVGRTTRQHVQDR